MMTQASADMLVSKTLKQMSKKKSTNEDALRLRKALINASKSGLLKRLMD